MEDLEIVELLIQRSETAINEMSSKYENYCFSIAWNILLNREDAKECVNDTWFATWKCIPPNSPSILSTFLGKVTRRISIDYLRKENAVKRRANKLCLVLEELDECISTGLSVDDELEKKEFLKKINEYLTSLSNEDRDIFIRRYWYIDNIEEIAKRHGKSKSSIKSNLYRTRKKLKDFLVQEGEIYGEY